jgi:cell division protein FtsB
VPQTPDIEPISKQLTIVVGLTVVGFMAFGLALSFYRNILFEETLKTIEQQNGQITKEIEQGYRDLEYFRSEQFRDKFAKENLGKVQTGEKVLIVTQKGTAAFLETENDAADAERKEAAYLELLRQMPVIEHWKLYLFHRDNIEAMKKAL